MRKLIALLGILFLPSLSWGQLKFYLDPDVVTGSHTGIQTDPWQSLNWVTINNALVTNDVIVYFSASNAAHTANQTSTSQINILRTNTSSHTLTLDGISFYNNNDSTPPSTWPANFTPVPCVYGVGTCGWGGAFKFQITNTSSPITSNNDAGTGCRTGVNVSGFKTIQTGGGAGSQAFDWVYMENTVVQYMEISAASTTSGPGAYIGPGNHGPGTGCGHTGVPNVTFQYNYVHDTYGECVYVGASSSDPVTTPFATVTGDNYLLQYNRVENCARWGAQGEGFDIKDGHTNLRVIGNIVRPNLAGLAPAPDGQGIEFESATLIDGNYVERPEHNGITVASAWCNSVGRGTVDIRNNIVVNTTGSGHRNGIEIFDTTCNNTHNWQAVHFYNNSVFNTADLCISVVSSGNNNNVATIENNICHTTGGITSGAKVAVSDYNDVFNGGSASGAHSISTDPKYVSTSIPYTATNFQLQAGSPAATIGANLAASFTDDYIGASRSLFSSQNLDDNASGWRFCWSGGVGPQLCSPGGSGTVTSGPTQTFVNASPSLDGNSEKIAFTGTAFTDVLFLYEDGPHNTVTYLQGDYWVNITAGNYQDLEYDTYQYLHASLDDFMYGSQCHIGGFWQIWDALNGAWHNTSVTCSLSTGAWHHIVWNVHRVSGDTSCSSHPCMHYDTLTIDGVSNAINTTYPAGVLPGTFADQTGLNFQLDTNGSGGAVSEFIDEAGMIGGTAPWAMGAWAVSGTGAPAVSLSPTSIDFGSIAVGSTSPQQAVTLTNSGSATLNITSVALTGIHAGSYSITSNACVGAVLAGNSCVVQTTFHPAAPGSFNSAGLTFTTDAASSPDTVTLAGTGVATAPFVTLTYTGAPTALDFGNQTVNTTSAGKAITLTNTGTATLNITSILGGGANPGQYTILSNTCGATLSASFSCTVTVAFAPTSVGSKPASIIFTTDAASSPDTVVLSGVGISASPAAVCAACFAQLKVPTIFSCTNVVTGAAGLNFNNCNCTCK